MGSLITFYIKDKTIFECVVYLNDKEKESFKQTMLQIAQARWQSGDFVIVECDFDWREYNIETLSAIIELNLKPPMDNFLLI